MKNEYAKSIEEAKAKYLKFHKTDPFPEILPSLLNSADIKDYVAVTGMVYPFDENKIKPATYLLKILGPYVFWDSQNKRREGVLEKGQFLTMEPDSILFITLEPFIQMPEYIAGRMNLRIDHLYKGLLVGSGTLIDPGFVGKLSIPLHNFTSNQYMFRGGEEFIWLEFVKVSRNAKWLDDGGKITRQGELKEFNPSKKEKTLDDYLFEADKRPIQSSIPLSIKRAEISAAKASRLATIVASFNIAIVITALALIVTVFFQTSSFYRDAKTDMTKDSKKLHEDDSIKIKKLEEKIDSLKK